MTWTEADDFWSGDAFDDALMAIDQQDDLEWW